MKDFHAPRRSAHHPQRFMAICARPPRRAVPARVDLLRRGAEAAGCTFRVPSDHAPGRNTAAKLQLLLVQEGEYISDASGGDLTSFQTDIKEGA